ncbi:hypothetical protein ASB57_28465 [Bordetella sp. N]|nr:hypothetical protein ASB57_28465 [Bordetella sp. N]
MDPFNVLNWRHHLLSLRWMDVLAPATLRAFLADFHDFHFVRKQANSMVGTANGDHTTTIRLEYLGTFRAVFQGQGDRKGVILCERLMREDMVALLSPAVYRPGHNHGVMADTALLEALDAMGSDDMDLRESVVRRGMASQAALYDEAGVTREHSVSYQEHNYPVVLRFLRAAAAGLTEVQRAQQGRLANASRELCAYFTRSNGQFFPIGDSFRLPNAAILAAHPEIDPAVARPDDPVDAAERLYCKSGFFSYIRELPGPRVHFVATATWNSAHHKQDDELSFCLELDGRMVFDDPGYSDAANPGVTKALGTADVHSAVTVADAPFGGRSRRPTGSGLRSWSRHEGGFELRGSHSRIPGIVVSRCWTLTGNKLTLTDWIKVSGGEGEGVAADGNLRLGMHGFVLAPDVAFVEIDGCIHLSRGGDPVGMVRASDSSGTWSAAPVPYVGTDRRQIDQTTRLVYTAPAHTAHVFEFTFA